MKPKTPLTALPIRAVLFDWNGTLIADLPHAYRAWMACFALLGVKKITFREFRRTYGLPWQSFYRRHGGDATTLRRERKRLSVLYRQIWRQSGIRLVPGVKAVVTQLRAQKKHLGILSDDPRREIVKLLKHWRLRRHFTFIGTSEQFPSKPSPAGIHAFLNHCRCRPREAMFVGDLADDLRAGRAAGVTTVAYLKGWQAPAVLRRAKPDYAIRKLNEIVRLDD